MGRPGEDFPASMLYIGFLGDQRGTYSNGRGKGKAQLCSSGGMKSGNL